MDGCINSWNGTLILWIQIKFSRITKHGFFSEYQHCYCELVDRFYETDMSECCTKTFSRFNLSNLTNNLTTDFRQSISAQKVMSTASTTCSLFHYIHQMIQTKWRHYRNLNTNIIDELLFFPKRATGKVIFLSFWRNWCLMIMSWSTYLLSSITSTGKCQWLSTPKQLRF